MQAISKYLRTLATRGTVDPAGPPRRMDDHEAQALWSAVLDGGVAEFELGALLAALSVAGESVDDLLGLHRALAARGARFAPALDRRPIAIPLYGLVPGEAAFGALLALFLRRFEVPVVLHGCLESFAEPSAAVLLRELDMLPCSSVAEAEHRLAVEGMAFVPAQLMAPALGDLLCLRARLGSPTTAHLVGTAIDPGAMGAVRLTALVPGTPAAGLAAFVAATGGDAMSLDWPAGETPANLALRPRISWISDGREQLLFEAGTARRPPWPMPDAPAAAAAWIRRVAERRVPAPVPLVNVAAACVLASGFATDIAQAKAIVALQCGRLAA